MISEFVEYVKQVWKNKPNVSSPLNADRLNHMEAGIENNSKKIKETVTAVNELTEKTNKTVGAANRPVYFKDGVPTQCSCTVDKSVPNNAVFTDRTTSIITKKFYKGKVTIGDHGTTDIPLATPSGYTYAGIIGVWPIGTVVPLYVDRDGSTSSKAKVWSPNSGNVTFSNIGVEVQYYKNA